MAIVEIIPEQYPTDQFSLDAIRNSGEMSVFFVWNETVTGFVDSDIALTGANGITFRGGGCCYEYVITPTGSDGDAVTLTVNANAVNEGNSQTTLTITQNARELKITALPFTNAVAYEGIAVNHNRVYLASVASNTITVHAFQYDGTLVASEERTITDTNTPRHVRLDLLNDRLFVSRSFQLPANTWGRRITALDSAGNDWVTHEFIVDSTDYGFENSTSLVETPCGFTHVNYGLVGIIDAGFGLFPFDGSDVSDTQNIEIDGMMVDWHPQTSIAGDGDTVYAIENGRSDAIQVYRFTSTSDVVFVERFNRSGYPAVVYGLSVYNGKLYILNPNTVFTADLPVLDAPVPKFRTDTTAFCPFR